MLINIEVDGAFYKTQKVSFDTDHTYLLTDIDLKSNKLGGHKIKVSLDNGVNTWIDWNVVNEKAIVYGFSDALDPDVGVLNRVAKNKFIKLIWNFDFTFECIFCSKITGRIQHFQVSICLDIRI